MVERIPDGETTAPRRSGAAAILVLAASGLACSPRPPDEPANAAPHTSSPVPPPEPAPPVAQSAPDSGAGGVGGAAPSVERAVPSLQLTAAPAAPSCPEAPPPAGFERCQWVELTDAPPCEGVCVRARRAARNRCCEEPVDVVVLSGTRPLLKVAACTIVPPDCAHRHGHGNMSDAVRFVEGSPMELVVVEGGCEMRAMLHGYVPPGVAAWTGCDHVRYQWDGKRMVKRAENLSR